MLINLQALGLVWHRSSRTCIITMEILSNIFPSTLLNTMGVNVLLALAMWISLAHNQEAFAQVAFMSIGAYASALLTTIAGRGFLPALVVGGLIPMVIALPIGLIVLRLRGIFLAIATVALGEVVRGVFINIDLIGGSLGISNIPLRTNPLQFVVAVPLVVYVFWRLRNSKTGRALRAMREDLVAAQANGVAVHRYNLLLFSMGAFVAGLAGAFSAHYMNFIDPNQFVFSRLIHILSFVIVGGLASYWGPVLGALVLTWMSDFLQWTQAFQLLINGAIMLAILLFFPAGLFGMLRKFHESLGSFTKLQSLKAGLRAFRRLGAGDD